MELKLHANATTTPRTRAYIQQSRAPVAALARELGVSETTIRRWRGRRTVTDRSHTPRRLATSLSLVEEALVCELRARLGLPLDDIAEVMRRCVRIGLSRSAIHRCLVRHGLNRRPVADKPRPGVFEPATLGFIHVDLKHLTRLAGRPSFVFVAIDRATRFVHIAIVARRDAATIAACLERFIATFPHEIHTVLTDNGSEFTDRFGDARWRSRRSGTGRHPFDRVCASHGIEHRLTRPFHPQTTGLVERFNRRLAQAIHDKPGLATNEGKNKFHSHAERDAFLHAFVHDYNRTRLKCLDYHAPLDLLTNQPGPNTTATLAFRKPLRRAIARPPLRKAEVRLIFTSSTFAAS
jgi:transposase InsO family protein